MNGFVDLDYVWYCAASNVVVATVLTVVTAAVARWMRRPALTHGLAVLALLALVTPPVFSVPVLPAIPAPSPEPAAPAIDPAALGAWLSATPTAPQAAPRAPVEAAGVIDGTTLLLGAWGLGSLAVLLAIVLRGRRFSRLLRHARSPSVGLAAEVRRLAAQLGLKRPPDIAVVAARVSPMLWPAATRLVLVLPEPLLRVLTPDQRATLLLHELAHVRRRDHWVRRLETLVTVVFWWLPTVWWLRGCLRHAEEQCCDAWVVWALPESERAYADALLSTVDFLSGVRFALPPQASGAGHVHHLKERLTMIMEATTPRRLSTASRLAVVVLAAALLPVLPTQAQEKEKKRSEPELSEAIERIEELEEVVKKMMAKHGESVAETLENVREFTVDREELEQQVRDAVKAALQTSEQTRTLWRDLAKPETYTQLNKAAEWMKKGDYEALGESYRKAAELMNEGELEAAQESYRKALQSLSTIDVDGENIRKAVQDALRAARVGDAAKYSEHLFQNLDTWRRKNPDAWQATPEQWKKFAEKWRRGEQADAWHQVYQNLRKRGDGDHDETDETTDRERRIEKIQGQINALQKQLKSLNSELRKLQRREY